MNESSSPALARSFSEVQRAVRAFHLAAGHPAPDVLSLLTAERIEQRVGWMREELEEFADGVDVVDHCDAMLDLIYFALGTLVEMGIDSGELFALVHEANLAKFSDGRLLRREDGKVLKPEGWVDPKGAIRDAILATPRLESEPGTSDG